MSLWIIAAVTVESRYVEGERLASDAHEAAIIQGKPSPVAAGCLYAVGRRGEYDRLTQQAIADAANVSAVSVRTHWQALQELD